MDNSLTLVALGYISRMDINQTANFCYGSRDHSMAPSHYVYYYIITSYIQVDFWIPTMSVEVG